MADYNIQYIITTMLSKKTGQSYSKTLYWWGVSYIFYYFAQVFNIWETLDHHFGLKDAAIDLVCAESKFDTFDWLGYIYYCYIIHCFCMFGVTG